MISPWSKFVFTRHTLLLKPTLSFALGGSLSFSLFPYPFLFPLSCVGTIGIGCDRSGVGFLAIGRHICVALPLSFHPVGLRCDAPVEDLVKIRGVGHAQRALPYNPVELGYLRTRPTPHSSSKYLRKSLQYTDPGPGCFSLPPYQGSELLRAASSFKRRRESRKLRSAVPLAAFLFVVFAVFGLSDLGPYLTGALHYIERTDRTDYVCNDTIGVSAPDSRGEQCFAKINMAHTHWQVPIDNNSQEMMFIQTPHGIFPPPACYRSVPMLVTVTRL